MNESQRFRVQQARDILGTWDLARDDGIYDRERVLADSIRALLEVIDQTAQASRAVAHDTDGGTGSTPDLSIGLAEQAGLIYWHVGVWHDLGYPEPLPSPDCHPIPPLGERPAAAIKGGHDAIEDIDEMIRRLHDLRARLVRELREDEEIRMARPMRAEAEAGFRAETGETR
jgi:hypothetical protein